MLSSKNNPFVSTLPAANLSTTKFPDLPKLENGIAAGMQRIIIPPKHLLTPHLHPDTNHLMSTSHYPLPPVPFSMHWLHLLPQMIVDFLFHALIPGTRPGCVGPTTVDD